MSIALAASIVAALPLLAQYAFSGFIWMAMVFFIIAILAYIVGAQGLAGVSEGAGRAMLFVFLAIAVILVIIAVAVGRT
jgi:uncharacterized membrane protein YtjA (UPF0391 family)